MKKYFKENKHFILIILFSIISSLCLFFKLDDYIWYYAIEESSLEKYKMPNGRYFSNIITHILVHNSALRFIFCMAVLVIFLVIMSQLIDFEKVSRKVSITFAFFLFLVMPAATYSQTVNWFSGFTNYILSFMLTGIYIYITFKILFTNYVPRKNFLMFFLAFVGGLCIENISIYNLIYSIVIIFLIKNRKKKIYSGNIFYFIGAILSVILMFFNDTYSQIISGNDETGVRNFEFSFSDVYSKMYKYVIPNYAKAFWIVHIIIAFSLLVMHLRQENHSKYEKICIYICIAYSVYSIFDSCFSEFIIISASMKIRAFEGAFIALYLLSLVYLFVKLLCVDSAIRCIIYLASTLIVIAPFIVVSPVTPRCIFADYIFWILLTGEIFLTAFKDYKFFKTNSFADIMFILPLTISVIITGINITNNYYDNIRFDYIKEQIDNNSKIIYLVELPYPDYEYEDFDETLFSEIHGTYIFRYHGIEVNPDDYKFIFISPEDYLLIKDA
ncbi:MAG: hypothetical protein K2K89_05390 [Ruminococcus sp.]|nr:hypothetical protein [Ruminococcus sp.]